MAGELHGGRAGRHSGDLHQRALYPSPKRRLGPPPAEEEDDTPKDFLDTLESLLSSPDLHRIKDRILTSATRGAAAGVLIKGGLHTLTFIMYLLGKLRGGKGRQRAISLADVVRDTVVHTAFFAALGSTYTAVDEGLALVLGKERWVNARVHVTTNKAALGGGTLPSNILRGLAGCPRACAFPNWDCCLGYQRSVHGRLQERHRLGHLSGHNAAVCNRCSAGLGGGGRWSLAS